MAENRNILTPEKVKTLSNLVDVRKISDLEEKKIYDNVSGEIRTSTEFAGSYLVTSTYLNDRYYNYRVKLQELTNYIREVGGSDIISFKRAFDYFIEKFKENTQNSYVSFVFANDSTSDDINMNYSYTLDFKLSQIKEGEHIGFSYKEGEDSTYVFTNSLTDGLVTSDVLEKYVRDTLGRIIGVPNSPAALSEAMDSIIEFVDWFKGFSTSDDNYQSLLDLINNISSIEIDDNNKSFSSGNTQYTLDIRNGKLGLYPYTSFTASVSQGLGSDSVEYGVNEDKTKDIIVTTNKDFTYSEWTTSGTGAQVISTTKNSNTKLTINVKYNTANTATFNGTVTEVDGNGTTKNLSASSSTTRTYRYWYLSSNSDSESFNDDLSNWTSGSLSTIGYPTNGSALVTNPNGKYLYIMFKHKDNPKFYVGGGTEKASFPGATTFISENNKPYSGGPNYDIWRTTEPQSGQINIIIE